MTVPTRLTPGSRAYLTGDKAAHIIRSTDGRFAYPWCAHVAGIALLAEVDGTPESAKVAREGMPLCADCREVLDVTAAHPSPGQLLRQKRTERDWTQVRCAAALKVHRPTVADMERGHTAITPAMALRLEAVLGVPALEWLRLQNVVDLERARRVA